MREDSYSKPTEFTEQFHDYESMSNTRKSFSPAMTSKSSSIAERREAKAQSKQNDSVEEVVPKVRERLAFLVIPCKVPISDASPSILSPL